MPRVSPATKVKPTPRVYQPVYPASPMTIAGGVSRTCPPPRGNPRGRTCSGATSRPGRVPGVPARPRKRRRNKRRGASRRRARATPSLVCLRPEEHRKRKKDRRSRRRQRSTRRRRRRRSPHRRSPHRKRNRRARVGSDRKRTRKKTRALMLINVPAAWAATGRARVPNRSTNPVEMRREFLAGRRREAAANAPRTPGGRGRRRGLHKQARVPTRTRKKTRTKTKTIKRVGTRVSRATRSAFINEASFHAFPPAWFARTFGPARPSSPVAPRTRSRPRARGTSSRRTRPQRGRTRPEGPPRARRASSPSPNRGGGACFRRRAGPRRRTRPYRRTGRTRGTSSSGSRGRVPARAGASTRNAPTCSPRTRRRARRARIPGEDTFSVSLCMYR